MSESSFIGKFVCYDQADGCACWGRIVDEAIVNTMEGEKEVFILDNRYVRAWRTRDLRRYRVFHPDMNDPHLSRPGSALGPSDEPHQQVRKVKGQTTLRKEMIDLENDIVDLSEVLAVVDENALFKAILSTKVAGKTALEIGLSALVQDEHLSEEVKGALKQRLGM